MDSETEEGSWADPGLILFAAVHANVSVTKIKITPKQVRIEASKKATKIRRGTFENWSLSDLTAYLKRQLA